MLIIPAIDIRGGRGVRLTQGDYSRERVYEPDPVVVVERIAAAGARRLHLVDLDAARGRGDLGSAAAARRVLTAAVGAGIAVEVGGGVRSREAAERWLEAGASWVVLGSVAAREPEVAEAICAGLPGRCLVSLDVRDGVARVQGWTETAGTAEAHLDRWRAWPLAGLIRTEVSLDGMLGGPDLAGIAATVRAFPGPVLASGGVTALEDVERLAGCGAAGAIVGRALFEGSFDLGAALRRFGPTRQAGR
jgi:phosphoribosylformimino-5-aminoimidazole carboxamide ribotide isomerase